MSSAKNKPRRWWRTISVRLNAWYVAVFITLLVLGALGTRWMVDRSMREEQRIIVRAELDRYQLHFATTDREGITKKVSESTSGLMTRSFVRIVDGDNTTLAYNGLAKEEEFQHGELHPDENSRKSETYGADGHQWILTHERINDSLWIQIGVDDQPRQTLLRRIERGILGLLGFGALLGVLGGIVLARRALAPIRTLAKASDTIIQSGDLDARLPQTHTGDEIDELSNRFNQVLEKNQHLVVGMREALDNVAHDLRTPLTHLRSSAELALTKEDSRDQLRSALADCVEESDRVLITLRTLMDISEAQTGVMHLDRKPVDLHKLCERSVDLYELVAEDRNVKLTLAESPPVLVNVDSTRILQVLANLIDNAIKYSDAGGAVQVSVQDNGDTATATVVDSGIGIDKQYQDKIWTRLYRADASRSRRGLGLGLSYVKAVVEAHGGTVSICSTPEQGSTFHITLPRETTNEE